MLEENCGPHCREQIGEVWQVDGNRTNEPTEAQVEVAAKAMWDLRKRASDPEWEGGELDHGIKEIYRQDARAALVAAQSAAPQAESKCQTCSREASFCAHCVAEMELAPVLPSSTVDEDALAEVIEGTIRRSWETFNNRREGSQVIARTVAEWLKEQGR